MVKKICIIIIVCCIILSSCSKADKNKKPVTDDSINILEQIYNSRGINPDAQEKKKTLNELEYLSGKDRTYEEIREQYPDKTILSIWNKFVPNDYIVDALNEYLVRSGTEYMIYFRMPTKEEFLLANYENNEIQLMEDLIPSVDIIQIKREYYYNMAKEGKLVPWNEYFASEEGRKLYEAMPENNWKATEINGIIYGITGLSENLAGAKRMLLK